MVACKASPDRNEAPYTGSAEVVGVVSAAGADAGVAAAGSGWEGAAGGAG